MTDSVNSQRLNFHGLDSNIRDTLRANKAFILSELPSALDAFYDHVARFEETAKFFKNRQHMMHAKAMQLKHWELITNGEFGADYLTSVTKIGEVHNKIGLEPHWYIGAYNFLLCAMLEAVARRYARRLPAFRLRSQPTENALQLQKALVKAVMLDTDYAISVYLDAGKRERSETLAALANTFEASVGGIVANVSESASGLSGTAAELSERSQQVLRQSASVSSVSERASNDVQTVAAASEELVASIGEISRQVGDAAVIASQAMAEAATTATQIETLSHAADSIGEIVGIISGIASQTNLLALNATIEAARAGEAGKGFAVVATEVKSLANETARATQSIERQISEIQASTSQSVNAIRNITIVIDQLNQVASAIASSVSQQRAATDEISHNILLVSNGTQEVAMNIGVVNQAANNTSEASEYVLRSAKDLAQQASKLQSEVESFLKQARSS